MFKRRSEIPYGRDSHFLLLMISILIFIATLGIFSIVLLQGIMELWYRAVSGTLTIQVLPVPGDSPAEIQKKIESIMTLLEKTPGIVSVQSLNHQKIAQLLESWLHVTELADTLQIPYLIDVIPHMRDSHDIENFFHFLEKSFHVSFDDHKILLRDIAYIGCRLEVLVLGILITVSTITTIVTIYVTKRGLVAHSSAIEILHLMGAHDAYIALQFGHGSLIQGLCGTFVGLTLALPVLITSASVFVSHFEGNGFLISSLQPLFLKLGISPILVICLTKMSAQITARNFLLSKF